MHRSTSFFAAIVATVLLIGGVGCAPPRYGMRRPAQEQPVCDSVDVQVEPLDPRIDAAFDRLHAATKNMPHNLPAVEARKTPPPPMRVASPFAKREADGATAIR